MSTGAFYGGFTMTNSNFPAIPGAYQINNNSGSFPIFGSLSLSKYNQENIGNSYFLLPGYALYVGNGSSPSDMGKLASVNNVNSTVAMKVNLSQSDKDDYVYLWYGKNLIPDPTSGTTSGLTPIPNYPS